MKLLTPDATPNPSEGDSQETKPKLWMVNSLTYTSAGLVALFCWLLLGDFAWSMRDRSVGPMAQWYLKNLGVTNLLFGLLVSSFPALVALVLGPIISVKSDRYRSRLGRRIPFLLVTTPIGAFGMLGIAFTPFVARWVHSLVPEQSETVVAVLCFGVFWAAFEFATIAGQAVFGGLINDVVPKALLGRFYGLFRAVSLIDGIIFNWWIMGKVPTHFTLILSVIAVFYGAAFMWVCFKVREGDYPPPAPKVEGLGVLQGALGSTRSYFKECFSNSYYLSVFGMLTMGALCFSPVNTFSIPYAKSLAMDMEVYGRCLALAFGVSLAISFFLGWLVDLFHPIRMSMVSLACYVVVSLWAWVYALNPQMFAVAFVLHCVFSGCYFTSAASLGLRLFPNQKFAQFASAGGMTLSVCTMAFSPIMGSIIDATGSEFRHTFLAGALLAIGALFASFYAYCKFMRLGGPAGYVAPE